MSTEKEALEYVVEQARPVKVDSGTREYSTIDLRPIKDPAPEPIKITTLTGLVDYVNKDIDQIRDKIMICINSHKSVSVRSVLQEKWQQRFSYLECEAQLPNLQLNNFLELEPFNIMMQSMFVENEGKASVLKVAGNVTENQVQTVGDDGVSQEVTGKAGIARVGSMPVPNPVELAPYRTFPEIDQPTSKFIFRMRSGPAAGLFEADGGAWKGEAIQRIKAYLSDKLLGIQIIA